MPARRLLVCLLALLALAPALQGCGNADVQSAADRARAQARQVQAEARTRVARAKARVRAQIEEILAGLKQSVPTAPPNAAPPAQTQGSTDRDVIAAFLTKTLKDIDGYWTTTLKQAGRPAPRVGYDWVPPGEVHRTGCGAPAGRDAAFYCPTDDTIYVSETFAAGVLRGIQRGFPGEQAGYGHAVGDFGLAYVIAHEYGHNVQQELGIFNYNPGRSVEPFELQADCFAGLWANSAFHRGLVKRGDVQEAIDTALAVGDFDLRSSQHHGTPVQRRDAWLSGYESGDPGTCGRYVPL